MVKDLSSPPAHPVEWLVSHVPPESWWMSMSPDEIVTARTWYEARAKASVLLGIAPEHLRVEMVTR